MEGLQRIHAAGVLHNDLRPTNVVLPRDTAGSGASWQPLWIDFSHSQLVDRAEQCDRIFEAEQSECRRMLRELPSRNVQHLQLGRYVATTALSRGHRSCVLRPRPPIPKRLQC